MGAVHDYEVQPRIIDLEHPPERRPMRWVIPGILPEGFTLLVGRPKAGKTTLIIQTAVELTRGGTLWGRVVERRRVAIIALERPEQIEDLIRSIRERDGWGSGKIDLWDPGNFPGPVNRHLDWWRVVLDRVGPGGVVIIDPLVDALEIEDLNDRAQVARALNPLRLEAAARGVSVVAIHHLNKTLRGERGVLGSTGFAAAADAILFLYPRRKGQEATLKGIGSRMPEFAVRLQRIPIEDGVAVWEAPEAPTAPTVAAPEVRENAPRLTDRERRILEDLTVNGPSTIREITARIGIPSKTVRKILYALRAAGLVQEDGERPRASYRGGSPEKIFRATQSVPEQPGDTEDVADPTVTHSYPELPTVSHSIPIYTQGHSRGDTLESADGDSISNAGITLKDITSRYNEFIQQRRNRANHDANSNESRVKDSDFSSESIKSARLSSISSDSARESNEMARIGNESSSNRREFNSIFVANLNEDSRDLDDWDDEEFARDPLDSLIDYLLDYSRGMSAILPQFFQFLDRRDGILEQGRKLAKNRPEVCLQVPRARNMMRRIVQECEDNALELEELAADLGLIRREEAERDWHPEILKALLAASFLHDPARMTRAEQFLEEPLWPRVPHNGPEGGAPHATQGHSQDAHKVAEASGSPDPAAEALIEPILQALDAGIRTDVALAERLKAPRYLVQEALRILAARGQVAAFASDGVCCWARVPRESEDSDSEPDSREVSSIPRESLNFNPESSESLSDSARISTNFDHDRADKSSISTESARNSSDGYREIFVHSNLAARFREVLRGRSRRPPADRRARVPTFERLLERYRELYLRAEERESARELSNSASISRNSSHDGRAEMKERIMALARMCPITCSMVSNRLGIPHARARELIGELIQEGRLRVENMMLVPARPRS
jgi:predicted ArsR family transcriptional regulator